LSAIAGGIGCAAGADAEPLPPGFGAAPLADPDAAGSDGDGDEEPEDDEVPDE
jgi:hypothetical protein